MKKIFYLVAVFWALSWLTGCGFYGGAAGSAKTNKVSAATAKNLQLSEKSTQNAGRPFTTKSRIYDVIHAAAFKNYGRLLFPLDSGYYSGDTLGELNLTWYSHIYPATTVEIVNYLHDCAVAGEKVFYHIYTPEEMAVEPEKCDTGLFFFKGRPDAKFAVCNAGGGFVYVGAIK